MIDNKNHDIEIRDTDDLLNKQYLGIVEDVNDLRREGRCKVRVFGLHEGIETDDLPWAYPKQKSMYFGKDGKGASVSVPKIGAIVAIRFDNGNKYSPEYFSPDELADDIKDEFKKDGKYFGSHVVLFDGDEELKIWFNLTDGMIIELKGSRINIGHDKAITITHADSQSSIELRGSEIKMVSNSTINITSASKVEVASAEIVADGNSVKIGKVPTNSMVLGEALVAALTTIAATADAKFPPSPGVAAAAVQSALLLSSSVKVSK